MTQEPLPPLSLPEVLEIVERRRRRRARVRSVGGPVLAVGAAGMAGLIVVTLQSGAARVEPAAQPPAAAPTSVSAGPPAQPSTAPPAEPPPFAPGYLDPDFLTELADTLFTGGPEDQADLDAAYRLATAWGIEPSPAAKAVVVKAELSGTAIDPTDPRGADELISRFEEAGYTDQDAAELAAAWGTDTRTAEIIGALVIEGSG